MAEERGGVGEGMSPAPSAFPARLLAIATAVVLLADVPGAFTRGDVLRGVLLPFLGALAAALGALAPGRTRAPGLLLALLLLPVAVPLLALAATVDATWSGVLRDSSVWLGVAALGAGLWCVWREEGDLLVAWRWLLGAGALAGLVTVCDALSRQAPGALPFSRPGVAGPVLAALFVAALWVPRSRRPGLHVAAACLIGAGCLATLSRTGFVAALIGLLVTGALGFGALLRVRRLWLGVVAALAAPAIVLALAGHVPGGGTTMDVRLGVWKATGELIKEHPLAGHGVGSFPTEILRVRTAEESAISRGRRPTVAHNEVLHASAEGGVPAGLVLSAFLVVLLVFGARSMRRAEDPRTRRLAAAGFGALLVLTIAALGENVFLDPAGGLVLAVAAASIAFLTGRSGGLRRVRFVALLALALPTLAAAGVKSRDLRADVHLARYRYAAVHAPEPFAAATAVQRELVEGALTWREDHPEALYRVGVHRARLQLYDRAREAWREALRADRGMTEAWLEIAHSYEREGRREDARQALREAARTDPTRFDVHMRLGHLALGKEPVPGEGAGDDFDPVVAHRHYNAAERCGPDRFEVSVARARIARRREELEQARTQLQRAEALSPKAAETLLESFRLAEAEGRTTDLGASTILALALMRDPVLGGVVDREAEDLLAEGRIREAAAKQAVKGTLQPPDYEAADRAYAAAARRLAGLLHARVLKPGAALAAARVDEEARAWRPALARLRAVLSWAVTAPPELGRTRLAWLRSLADAFERAGSAALRTDVPLSRYLFARAHATQGAVLVEEREWKAARDVLLKAVKTSPYDANVRLDLARAQVHVQEPDAALTTLLEALKIDPGVASRILREPDFDKLQARPALSNALR